MRTARIVNAVPNDHSNEANNDTEPNIAVNPANPNEMAITAFTPPDSGLTNGPIYYTTDRGENWSLLFDVPGNGSLDQTIGFASSSNELFTATLRADTSPLTLNVDRTADPTTGVFPSIETRTKLDQPWVHAITVSSGPDAGKVRTYVGYGDTSSGYWATVDCCFDALAANPAFTKVKLNPRSAQRDGFHIRPKPHADGTVYVGYQSWQSTSGVNVTMNMVVARDDNWGKNNFGDLSDPSDHKAGRLVANVTIDESTALGGQRPDNGFDVQVDPNNSDVVYLCWIDNGGAGFRLHVRRSLDRGQNWSGDLITVDNAALATMAINSQGTVALTYLDLVSGQWEAHFRTTSDGSTWDDLLLARTATNGFIGDYMRMVAVGPHFYGVFPAVNTPTAGNFFPNGGGTVRFQRNNNGTTLLGTNDTTVIASSTDPFFFLVEERDATFIVNRDPIGQDEVDARRTQPRGSVGGLPMQDVFRLVVDGFTAGELGLAGPGSTLASLPTVSPGTGMTIVAAGNSADNGDYGPEIQRFTFYYGIDFPDDSAFGFAGATEVVTLDATAGSVPASAQIELIKQPDPFMLHGDPSWLSVDLRVFVVRAGETKFGVPMGSDASAAPGFVQQLIGSMTSAQFDSLPTAEDDEAAKLFLQPSDSSGQLMFNFAVAKVHYVGLIGAANVRAFFRLFNAQSTATSFDLATTYRRAMNPAGQPIPLAGVQGTDYVTIPCFAAPRIDSTTQSMSAQTDDPNRQNFVAIGGPEVDHFYGCWLDINQPTKNVLPVQVPAANVDGPFTNAVPIQQSIVRNLHQCLVAEIAFDPTPIPAGKNTANWDKLAQRNLAWSDIGSAQAVSTFEIRPTRAGLPAGQPPDELMIDWGNIPSGSSAQIYLPAVDVDDVLSTAARMYTSHRLTRIDDHTLQCATGGVTYVPIPPGATVNYAGLLSVDVPGTGRRGGTYQVVVRQVTNAFGKRVPPPPPPPGLEAEVAAVGAAAEVEWRRVLGAFQLAIPVKAKQLLLVPEERDLSVLRWIAEAIPHHNRWHPVFHRYLEQIAGRVRTFGGDPTKILPSPTGEPEPKHPREQTRALTGKIAGLIFDHFGDFEGFLLETDEHEHRFSTRERDMAALAERAWHDQLRLTVIAEPHKPHTPLTIIIHQPPTPFHRHADA